MGVRGQRDSIRHLQHCTGITPYSFAGTSEAMQPTFV